MKVIFWNPAKLHNCANPELYQTLVEFEKQNGFSVSSAMNVESNEQLVAFLTVVEYEADVVLSYEILEIVNNA